MSFCQTEFHFLCNDRFERAIVSGAHSIFALALYFASSSSSGFELSLFHHQVPLVFSHSVLLRLHCCYNIEPNLLQSNTLVIDQTINRRLQRLHFCSSMYQSTVDFDDWDSFPSRDTRDYLDTTWQFGHFRRQITWDGRLISLILDGKIWRKNGRMASLENFGFVRGYSFHPPPSRSNQPTPIINFFSKWTSQSRDCSQGMKF